ncbi:MAG: hypothetical protein ACR2IK_22255 [Chloroflexota bacterium]
MKARGAAGETPALGNNRFLLLNSGVAFALALMLMITLHELAHAVTHLAYGSHPRLFAGHVSMNSLVPTAQSVASDLAGPIFSLVSGCLILSLPRLRSGFWGLAVLWLGLLSVQEFTGYLLTAPFVAFGDIGEALGLLSAPAWVYGVCFLAGAAGTFLLGRTATRRLLAMTAPESGSVAPQLRSLGLFAWLAGVALTFLLGAGADSLARDGLFELMGAATSGIFIVFARFFMRREVVSGSGLRVGWPVAGSIATLALGLVRQFVLGPGIQL